MQLVIDLCAHCLGGVTKLLQDKLVELDAHIFSVEANPNTFSSVLASHVIDEFRAANHSLSSFNYVNLAAGPSTGFVRFNSCSVVADNYNRVEKPWLRRYYLLKNILFRVKRNIRKQRSVYTHTSQGSNTLESPPSNDGDHTFIYDSLIVPQFTIIDITKHAIENIVCECPSLDLVYKIDIEGAEFEALESYLDEIKRSDLLGKIRSACFYVEWHERFFNDTESYIHRRRSISNDIRDIFGPQSLQDWH